MSHGKASSLTSYGGGDNNDGGDDGDGDDIGGGDDAIVHVKYWFESLKIRIDYLNLLTIRYYHTNVLLSSYNCIRS